MSQFFAKRNEKCLMRQRWFDTLWNITGIKKPFYEENRGVGSDWLLEKCFLLVVCLVIGGGVHGRKQQCLDCAPLAAITCGGNGERADAGKFLGGSTAVRARVTDKEIWLRLRGYSAGNPPFFKRR
jgi:hypothetical protein